MDLSVQERNSRLEFFRELLTCNYDLYTSICNNAYIPVYSNCPHYQMLNLIFSTDEKHIGFIDSVQDKGLPVVITNSLGFMWIADFEHDPHGALEFIHVIGPAFYDDYSETEISLALEKMHISYSVSYQFREILRTLPVISPARFLQYGQMLHYALTGDKIPTSDFIHMSNYSEDVHDKSIDQMQDAYRHGTWVAEQAMMKLIEEGNLDYRKHRDRLTTFEGGGSIGTTDPTRKIKNQLIVLTALCTRAAIRGGLSPSIAYTLSDRYIASIENCASTAESIDAAHAMEDDFIRRVHQIRHQSGISPQIQQCCDYILLHTGEKITVDQLANMVGHASNYLIKKFRQETGKTISAFIMETKMERAKLLLRDDSGPIQDVAEQLGFATQSHFGAKFKEYTGMTPAQWRGAKK